MLLDAVVERLVERSPMAVAVRGAFEHALDPAHRDALFVRIAGDRDGRELLFSTCADLVAAVVCRVKPSAHAAYQADHRPVSVSAVYARLARVPVAAGRELVRHTAERLGPVVRAMGGPAPDPLPGYRVKVPGGNHPGKTQRRIQALRDVAAGPVPGRTPAVLDPALGLAIGVVCCADGRAQERSRLGPILEAVGGNGVWAADRNFCATGFLFGIAQRKGFFVIRRHAATLSRERESDWAAVGRTGTGTLSERTIRPTEPDGGELAVRRARLTLGHPTRGGDGVVEVLTNPPAEVAVASAVAELYRGRWSVEGLFLRPTTALKCEVNALGYPPAALFGFCAALAAGSVYAAVEGALRAAHGAAVAGGVPDYHPALEVSGACPGLWIAAPVEMWAGIGAWSVGPMAEWLEGLAQGINLGRYRKATRGPKKPKLPRTRFPEAKHVATSRLLSGEQT